MVETLLRAGLSNAVLAAVLALLVGSLCLFCRRPAVRHALWLLVLLKLVAPPVLPLSLSWPQSAAQANVSLNTTSVEEDVNLVPSLDDVASPNTVVVEDPAALLRGPEPPPSHIPWQEALLAAWLGSAVVFWLFAGMRAWRFQRFLRQLALGPSEVAERTAGLARRIGLKRAPCVSLVEAPVPPLLWALWGVPRLLLPASLWGRLSASQRDALLVHELAHLRRGDPRVRLFEILVTGLYWWHPALWWA